MRIKFRDLRCRMTGVVRRTRRPWTSLHSRAFSGSRSTFRSLVYHSRPARASLCQSVDAHEAVLG